MDELQLRSQIMQITAELFETALPNSGFCFLSFRDGAADAFSFVSNRPTADVIAMMRALIVDYEAGLLPDKTYQETEGH